MIPRTVPTWQRQSWQEQLIDSIRDWDELFQYLELSPNDFPKFNHLAIDQAMNAFPLKVPRHYAAQMAKSNPQDPLLLQILPQAQEMVAAPGYSLDPLLETGATEGLGKNSVEQNSPGVIQKYRSRVLLMISSACAVHCRYCFRRHFPYHEHQRSKKDWEKSLAQIADDPQVNEIILSGGDPLSANDRLLGWLVDQIHSLPKVTTLRIHTRLPVVIPDRLDQNCLAWLRRHPDLQKVMVLHCNHPQEISSELATGVEALRKNGIHVLNQSVLLKGVNDCADTLIELSEALFKNGIMPYYLHLLDKVIGTHHFDVEEKRARQLHREISASLPGYLLPKLAREIPGNNSKTVLA